MVATWLEYDFYLRCHRPAGQKRGIGINSGLSAVKFFRRFDGMYEVCDIPQTPATARLSAWTNSIIIIYYCIILYYLARTSYSWGLYVHHSCESSQLRRAPLGDLPSGPWSVKKLCYFNAFSILSNKARKKTVE